MSNISEEVEVALVEISAIVKDIHKVLGVRTKGSVCEGIIQRYRDGLLDEEEVRWLEAVIWLGIQGHDVLKWMILVGDIKENIKAYTYDVSALGTILYSRVEGYGK